METLKSTRNPQFLLQYAKECIKKDNYFDGIVALSDAVFLDDTNIECNILLAETYYEVGSYEKSSHIYHKLLAQKCAHFEFVFALARNEYALQRSPIENNYVINTVDNIRNLRHDHLESLAHIWDDKVVLKIFASLKPQDDKEPQLVNLQERKDAQLLTEILERLRNEDLDKVIMLGYQMPKESANYVFTREIMASSAFKRGDMELSVSLSESLNEGDKLSFTAFFILAQLAIQKKDDEALTLLLDSVIKKCNTGDSTDIKLRKITMQLVILSKNNYALKSAKIAYEYEPLADTNIVMYILCLLLCKKTQVAKPLLKRSLILYPKDFKLRLIDYLIGKKINKHWRSILINDFFVLKDIINDDMQQTFQSAALMTNLPQAYDLLELALCVVGAIEVFEYLGVLLITDRQNCINFMISKLHDYQTDFINRLALVELLLAESDVNKQVLFLSQEGLVEIKIKTLDEKSLDKNPEKAFSDAYIRVFVKLLSLGVEPIGRILEAVIKEMSFCPSELCNKNLVAATAHYYYFIYQGTEPTLEPIAPLYMTTVKALQKYIKEYNINVK